MGWSKEATDFRTTTGSVRPTGIPAGRRPGLSLVLLGAAALAALLFLFRGRRPETPAVPEGPKVGRVEAPKMEAPKAPQVFSAADLSIQQIAERILADPNAHVPKRVGLDGVFFFSELDVAIAHGASIARPDRNGLEAEPNAKVRIEAFTDASGDVTNDQRLSTQRAYSVRDVLVQEGINPSRISVAGFGSERPIAPADTAEGRAKNSRVELVITER